MKGSEIRSKFLKYFEKHGHKIVRSASLIPHADPTLLFTNAGMVPFKRVFLGEEKLKYRRASSSQKCVRAGGKHNDLENVGYTARHHTFFEMLGNFSFGDYFKEKAITLAWDLIVNEYNISPDNLWISVYKDDDDAFNIWDKNIGVKTDRIVRLGDKDNFWSMGDTGPCGPCSEIHIDRGKEFACKKSDCGVGCDCDRYLEIWNLVFMEYNRDSKGNMELLPEPSIDTGMGLERIASVINSVPTNYETDLFYPIIKKIEEISEIEMGKSAETEVAVKVIADHSRAAAFLIGDGVLPSNESRGYVLRRIIRRAIRYGRNLNLKKPFLYKTAHEVVKLMSYAYPELSDADAFITTVIKNEEIRFSETLDYGLKLLDETVENLNAKGIKTIPGDVIFKLYDTYGFPVDIIKDVVRDREMSLDMDEYQKNMDNQRRQSRSVTGFLSVSDVYKKFSSKGVIPEFTGYNSLSDNAEILVLVKEGSEVAEASIGEEIEIVTDKTPFYAESGGQTGDAGKITADNLEIEVIDTVKEPSGLIIHKAKVVSGKVKKGQKILLSVSEDRRNMTALNHTATHILQAGLQKIVGDHVKQSGSMVSSERLRFDFSHFSAVTSEQLNQVEAYVNEKIRKNFTVDSVEMDQETAFKTGATALFEEKYGDMVRVVSMGEFSSEFCGGTHTQKTGDIGLFKIVSEASVAAGIRRIEALTGKTAIYDIQKTEMVVSDLVKRLKATPETLIAKTDKIIKEQKKFEKEIEKLKAKIAVLSAGSAAQDIKEIKGIKVLAQKVNVDNPAALRDLADKFKDKIKSGIIVLGANAGSKVMLIVVVTKDLTDQFHAGKLIKEISKIVGGGGGGKPSMAQAGGKNPEKTDEAVKHIYTLI